MVSFSILSSAQVLQMGLVSMFTLGLYLTPLLGAGEVLLQIRVDA